MPHRFDDEVVRHLRRLASLAPGSARTATQARGGATRGCTDHKDHRINFIITVIIVCLISRPLDGFQDLRALQVSTLHGQLKLV